jgi:hypothetical protein
MCEPVARHHLQQVVEVVRQAGRELADRFHLLGLQVGLLRDAPPRDVHLRGEPVEQLALIVEHRADEQAVPERAAVGLVVQDVDRHRPLLTQGPADLVDGVRVGLFALQETTVAAQDFLFLVQGEIEEGAVHESDRVVRLVRIGDHHRHAGHLDGGEEDVAALLEAGPGDVRCLPVTNARVAERIVGAAFQGAGRRRAGTLAVASLVLRKLVPLFRGTACRHLVSTC